MTTSERRWFVAFWMAHSYMTHAQAFAFVFARRAGR